MAKFYSQAKNIAVTGFRTPPMSNFSGISSIASTGFRTPPMTSFVPSAQLSVTEHLAALKAGSGLAVDGKLVDDRYISPSSSYLVDGKLIDDRYSAPSNPYLALASQYREHISPSLSSSYRYVRSAQLSVTERLAILKAGPGLVVVGKSIDDHFSSLSSSYRYVSSAQLSVTERLAILKAGPGLIVVSQFHDR
jgi:hypothetical protein